MANDKISLYSLNDLKNTSDDVIPTYLNSIKFRQSHKLCDVRLALGYVAISISASTFFWDYKYGFDSTKVYTAYAVIVYTIINAILTYWMTFVEKGIIYNGTNPNGDKIQISSMVEKLVPVYNLTITTYPNSQPRNPKTINLKRPFNEWFNKAGYLVALSFQQMLASNVPLIGAADPSRVLNSVAEKSQKSDISDDNSKIKDINEKWSSLLAESSGVDVNKASNVKDSKAIKKDRT